MKKGIWQLTDSIGSLAVAFGVLGLVTIPMIISFSNDQQYSNAAFHATKVYQASEKYIRDNESVIASAATATKPFAFNIQELIQKEYLPVGFSSKNVFSQDYKILVLEPSAGKFKSIVVTENGPDLSVSKARKIATRIGALGGYIESGIAKGALGAWTQNMAEFGLSPGDGHIAIANFFNSGVASSDFLYRKKIDGHPELNEMQTDLSLGGHNINSINNVTASGVLKGSAVESTGVIRGGKLESAGDIAANGHITSLGTVKGSRVESTGDIAANGAVSARDVVASNTITGGAVRSNGMLSGGSFLQLDGVANEGWGCSPNKMIGLNSAGEILSCQSGMWKSTGVTGTDISIYRCPYSICDNNSASTCAGQLSTQSTCQCRAGGWQVACPYVGKLVVK